MSDCWFFSGLFQCTNKLFLADQLAGLQIKEFARKNAANALSVANMVMGMASILSSLNGWVKKGRYWTVHCSAFVTLGCSSAKNELLSGAVDCWWLRNGNRGLLLCCDVTFLIHFWFAETEELWHMLWNVFFFLESFFISACLFHHILRCSPLHSQQFLMDKGKEVNSIQLNDRLRESKQSNSASGVTAEHLQHAFNGVCTFIQATVNRYH